MLILALAACGWSRPSVSMDGATLTSITWEQVGAEVAVRVHNPLPVDITVTGGSWTLDVVDHRVGSGTLDRTWVVEARCDTVVAVPVVLHLDDLPGSAELQADLLPYVVEGQLVIATPLGDRAVPFWWESELPRPHAPEWELVDWSAQLDGAAVIVTPTVRVTLPEGFAPGQLEWALRHGGRSVASGHVAPPQGDRLSIPARLDVREVGGAAWELAAGRGQQWDLWVQGEVVSPFGVLPLEVTTPLTGAPTDP